MRLLVFSAHAADFCSRSGGTIAIHTAAGDTVHVVGLTFGERGESEDYWDGAKSPNVSEAKAVRAEEARRAAGALGATIEFLDYGDYPLEIGAERLITLARAFRTHKPDLVITHWRRDPYNLDHEVTAAAVMRAATIAAVPGFDPESEIAACPVIYAFEPTVPRDPDTDFQPNQYVPIDSVFERKMAALRELRSQKKLPQFYTQCGEYRGWQARQWCGRPVRYAEAFYRHGAVVSPGLGSTRSD